MSKARLDLEIMRNEALTVLRAVATDGTAPAAARGAAARTILEYLGGIGRHQRPPNPDKKPLAEQTRAEMLAELKAQADADSPF